MSSYGLIASAINEDTMRSASLSTPPVDLWQALTSAKGIRVATVSPQMLRSAYISKLLDNPKTYQLLRWFFVDEAHLVHEESGEWCVAYASVKLMRHRLPAKAVWGLFTGTATPTEAKALAKALGLKQGYFVNVRYPCDRPHIKYINRIMQHPYSGNTFHDLAFLLSPDARSPADIPRTLVFCNTIELGSRVIAFLDALFPTSFPHRSEIVMPYNSLMSQEYRSLFMQDMVEGSRLRIGVCTETCTYGLDIPCIRRVVVFGLFPSFSAGKQRLCRGGRDGLPAEAYSLVPSWVRELPVEAIKGQQAQDDAARRAKLSPVVRQWHNPTPSLCPRQVDMQHNEEVYTAPSGPCCSIHQPEPESSRDAAAIAHHLVAYAQRYGDASAVRDPVPRSDGTHRALDAIMIKTVGRMLRAWRGRMWPKVRGRDRNSLSCDFLPSSIIDRIAHKAHVCTTIERLQRVIQTPTWAYTELYGDSLLAFLNEATTGFDQIFAERQTEAVQLDEPAVSLDEPVVLPDVDTPLVDGDKASAVSSSRLRLVFQKRQVVNMVVPEKRSTDERSSKAGNSKRVRVEKENS